MATRKWHAFSFEASQANLGSPSSPDTAFCIFQAGGEDKGSLSILVSCRGEPLRVCENKTDHSGLGLTSTGQMGRGYQCSRFGWSLDSTNALNGWAAPCQSGQGHCFPPSPLQSVGTAGLSWAMCCRSEHMGCLGVRKSPGITSWLLDHHLSFPRQASSYPHSQKRAAAETTAYKASRLHLAPLCTACFGKSRFALLICFGCD